MNWIRFRDEQIPIEELEEYNPKSTYEAEVVKYCLDWLGVKENFTFKTSGSTGKPKSININRSQIEASIQGTIKALNLKPNSTALLAINPAFIGGRMMIYRALINNMNLVIQKVTSNPLAQIDTNIDFAAFVPLQIGNALQSKSSTDKLSSIDNVIIGGGALSASIVDQLTGMTNSIFSTYGMTETVSHIALKEITSSEAHFTALEGVEIGQDDRGCLTIRGAVTNDETIMTNDIVQIYSDRKFDWLGRYDNVINTGGIKIQTEVLENKIGALFHKHNLQYQFFISSESDDALGERIVMNVESKHDYSNEFIKMLRKHLDRYEIPKKIYFKTKFTLTDSGKIDRLKTISDD